MGDALLLFLVCSIEDCVFLGDFSGDCADFFSGDFTCNLDGNSGGPAVACGTEMFTMASLAEDQLGIERRLPEPDKV